MKKGILLALAVGLASTSAFAQVSELPARPTPLSGKDLNSVPTTPHGSPLRKTRGYGNPGVTIGTTFYDLQTNGSMSRRIVNFGGGKVSAVWTFSSTADAQGGAFADRGTGYNHNNGSAWGPQPGSRIEAFRTGFTNIESIGSGELIVSHAAGGNGTVGSQGMFVFKNSAVGSSTFPLVANLNTGSNADTILWPKVATDGSNVYVIGCNTNRSNTALTGLKYTKSSDNGATWSPMIDMPGITVDSIYNINADAYNIAARNGKVAVVCGDVLTNGYVIISGNGGATWSAQPFFRTGLKPGVNPFNVPTILAGAVPPADTAVFVPCTDGTASVHIGSDGTVGVLYNLMFGFRDSTTNPGSYFPARGASFSLNYWDESLPANNFIPVDTFVDCDGDGEWTLGTGTNRFGSNAQGAAYGGFGANNYPQTALVNGPSGADTIFAVYAVQMDGDSSTTADFGPIGQTYRDIFLSVSFDGGGSWNNRINLSNTPGVEEMFPSIARLVDGNIHVIWQEDAEPGTVLTNGDIQGDANKIKYLKMSVADAIQHAVDGDRTCWDNTFIPASLSDLDAPVFNVYPNPATSSVTIEGNLTNATINVVNALGQAANVAIINKSNSSVVLNTENLVAGIYLATITKDGVASTVRFVKK